MVLNNVKSILVVFIFLIIIILIGVLFDIIGIAATAANESSFHSRAARRLFGAQQSIRLVKNADKVASYCSDMVGDICGTVSGAIGAAIVFRLSSDLAKNQDIFWGTVMTGVVAALTVGGKAAGKSFAINESDQIILWTGQVLAWFEQLVGIKQGKNARTKRKNKNRGKKLRNNN